MCEGGQRKRERRGVDGMCSGWGKGWGQFRTATRKRKLEKRGEGWMKIKIMGAGE